MLKRNPYIAVLMVLLAFTAVIWAIITASNYILYNPIERLKIADLPPEATSIEKYNYSPFASAMKDQTSMPFTGEFNPINIPGVDTSEFSGAMVKEREFELAAQTRSALDPLKDESLRNMLKQLNELRYSFESENLSRSQKIFDEVFAESDAIFFRYKLYSALSSDNILASMDNPNLYPIRQAEIKSAYYANKSEIESIKLDEFKNNFESRMTTEKVSWNTSHKKLEEEMITSIRDYLIEKTRAIEQGTLNSQNQTEN